MNDSHEVINLESMAQCLDDARTLLRDGDMCVDTYVSLLEDAAKRIRSVLAFAQDIGLEIIDGEETEAWKIVDRFTLVDAFRRNISQNKDDLDIYLDHQSPTGVLVVEPRSETYGHAERHVYCYDLGNLMDTDSFRPLKRHYWGVA
jgi:hypothetical protein